MLVYVYVRLDVYAEVDKRIISECVHVLYNTYL